MTSGQERQPLWVVGDVHGQFTRMKRVLQDAGLIDAALSWTGGAARLLFMGDFFDRGPDGVSSLALAMKLAEEAPRSGGWADALVGNHEVNILGATRFPRSEALVQMWGRNGGMPDEPDKLTPDMLDWMMTRPAMLLENDLLLMHADAAFYALFGQSIEQVNAVFREMLSARQPGSYEYLGDLFFEHRTFFNGPESGAARAAYMRERFGGVAIVHGHTPIHTMSGAPPASVIAPFVYDDGRCINVDGSMYSGGPGFAVRFG